MKKIYWSLIPMAIMSCQSSPEEVALTYPQTPTCDSSYQYFGMEVKDPYGWLEDDYADSTLAWVKKQNEISRKYLDEIPEREELHKRLSEVWNYEKFGTPFKKAGQTFFFKNNGVQNQSVLYRSTAQGDQVILDPNSWSKDGTASISGLAVSSNGKYLAYGRSDSGSDWTKIFVMDLSTLQLLPDVLEWVKFSGISWEGDGFYYSRYDAPQKGEEYSQKNEFHQVYYHKLGQNQAADKLVYRDPSDGQKTAGAYTTSDEAFVFLTTAKGTSGSSLAFRKTSENAFTNIDTSSVWEYNVLGSFQGKIYIMTNYEAPNWKLVEMDPLNPKREQWKTILPAGKHFLQSAALANGKILANYLEDVSNHLYSFSLDGKKLGEFTFPPFGTIGGLEADEKSNEAFVSYSNFTSPGTVYKLMVNEIKAEVYRKPQLKADLDRFVTEQVFYKSKDGTRIPMFLTYKKGLKKNGQNPTFLYGYGGFNICIQPNFAVDFIPFLEDGGIYAVANIRGGNEYGESWHEQGIKLNKQNVFDDFASAAEYLIKEQYTSSQKLAVHGRSNGGLLIGAMITQRPDLFAVALPKVGVLDMLRYHKFTIGWAWASDYGRSDDSPEMFKYLLKYSPLHNVVPREYPAIMVITGDHDDRVVPAHSFKFTAALQKNQTGKKPVILRVDTNAGHGAGKPISKQIDEFADQWAFIYKHLKIK
ncbi:MAG TPA: prolyl oligopeptidase family serine peptidase [Luteibaculaceae bacterium]|nr:prolyl oligopeptidase family serine peptidase [Luteibaculaceae bacterium]